jgi:hypothetical protein
MKTKPIRRALRGNPKGLGECDLEKQSQSPTFGRKSEALSSKSETTIFDRLNLKKQSQFMSGLMGVTPFMKGTFDNISPASKDENKAKQSQFDAPFWPERGPGAEQPHTAATR